MRFICLVLLSLVISCTTSQQALFSRRSPHELYTAKISEARLNNTIMGSAWLEAAGRALKVPLELTLPYLESGYFAASETDAQGYLFAVRRGEKVLVEVTAGQFNNARLFLDLWEPVENAAPTFLASSDTAANILEYEVKRDGRILLRMQPELLASVDYQLRIATSPSLGFPVSMTHHPKIGSFWGASRDAGARNHEGIDIFGAFHTPVVAAADGVVNSVSENRLGGRVIFMRPYQKDYSLYYAHLDVQLVQDGQRVKTGDTLGLMGNTGNAKNTPTHLHFGVYTSGGAIDPLPFVNANRKVPVAITSNIARIKNNVRCIKRTFLNNSTDNDAAKMLPIEKNTIVQVKAATGNWYKVLLPDRTQGYLPAATINDIDPLRTILIRQEQFLMDKPDSMASVKALIAKGTKVPVFGAFNNYYYVEADGQKGWINAAGGIDKDGLYN